MSIKSFIRHWLDIPDQKPQREATEHQDVKPCGMSRHVHGLPDDMAMDYDPFKIPEVAEGVVPVNSRGQRIAMDAVPVAFAPMVQDSTSITMPNIPTPQFLGYPTLSLLAQEPLIQAMVETLADEMTRRFIELKSIGDEGDENERLKQLEEEFEKFKVVKFFNEAATKTGYFGGCMLFIDMGDDTNTAEGRKELETPLTLDSKKVRQGSFKGFKVVEPVTCFPAPYNASNPLADDYFKPNHWYVMGMTVHKSRLLRFVQHEPPLLLKPAYNFFGIPFAQMVLDYVEKFTVSRWGVADLVDKFSVSVLKTDMGQVLQGGTNDATGLTTRATMFNLFRKNRRVLMVDKDREDYTQVNTPLSGLPEILTKMLEMMTVVSREPATKFMGISPSGFNATGESDMRNHYDNVKSQQEKWFQTNVEAVFKLLQINLWGEIDPALTWEFASLYETNEVEETTNRKTDADRDVVYIDRGVLSAEEVRQRLASDPKSGYSNIDADDMPEMPDEDAEALLSGLSGIGGEQKESEKVTE